MTTTQNYRTLKQVSTSEEAIAALAEDGVVCLPGLISGDKLERLQRDVFAHMESVAYGEDEHFAGTQTRRAGAALKHTRELDDVILNPVLLETAKHFLVQPKAVWYGQDNVIETPTVQMGVTQIIQIAPGQGLQPLHRDDSLFLTTHPGPECQVGFMVAVSDFTAENGATRVIPGSHKWDEERGPQVDETIAGEMKAGSVMMWLGSTYHGGGQNETTDQFRTGIVMAYVKSSLRQEENHYLSLPLDLVKEMPQELQDLVGYAASNPLLGWIEVNGQMTHPHVLLDRPATEMVTNKQ